MEELTQKINELIEAINANSVPLWLSIIGMIVPIVISLAVAIFAIVQHYQNKRLQMAISDKELMVQMHGDILSIYDNLCIAQNTIGRVGDNIAIIFANPNLQYQWWNELLNAINLVCQANNRAELLLPKSDKMMRETLKNILKKVRELCQDVNDYVNSGMAELSRQQSWSNICATYGILMNDYNFLSYNGKAADDFIKLCANDATKRIDKEIKDILALYDYDKFDIYFEPYLRLYSEEK